MKFSKNFVGDAINVENCEKCRSNRGEYHVTEECPVIARIKYLKKHKVIGKVYHQAIIDLHEEVIEVKVNRYAGDKKLVVNDIYRVKC